MSFYLTSKIKLETCETQFIKVEQAENTNKTTFSTNSKTFKTDNQNFQNENTRKVH